MPRKSMDRETLERIIHVAKDHFLQQGYHKTNMRQVARDAGVTTKPLYYHFGSKDDLLIQVCLYGLSLIDNRLQIAMKMTEGQPALVRMMTCYDTYVSFFMENIGYYDVITLTMSSLDRWKIDSAKREKLFEAIDRIFGHVATIQQDGDDGFSLQTILYGSSIYGIIHHYRTGFFDRNNITLGTIRNGVQTLSKLFAQKEFWVTVNDSPKDSMQSLIKTDS